ncbi:hydroxylamine reductase [bacterium]|nr:hydroxylamine reductase [bacterium]
MFCYQCEQTAQGSGCTAMGVCGKSPETAALQDLLVEAVKGICQYAWRANSAGLHDREIDVFVIEALFATVTNVDFDAARIEELLHQAAELRDRARGMCKSAGLRVEVASDAAAGWQPAETRDGLVEQGQGVSIASRQRQLGGDVNGLMELYLYGLKGAAAYADHALILGVEDEQLYADFNEAMCYLAEGPFTIDELTKRCLAAGEINLRVMELLDRANTTAYGHPVPTKVRTTPVKGKAILVSGHDLKDLEELLKQTEGQGINVYTHGEMLPCHAYPGLNKYNHLVGNYGGAWQDQAREFSEFPGAILMTTNCIQKPREDYKNRIFTTGLVGWPGVTHVTDYQFGPVIQAALAAPGFAEDAAEHTITVGFGHNAVLGVADKVIEAVKNGAIRHFFLIGGCDGAKTGRNYYTELAEQVPDDCMILTLACGKYRFNKLEFGEIGGIPRLLDIGQCNDAYSAIKIAVALAGAFGCTVNELPLSLVLSWYEQKAVAILLTLLHLGIKGIRIGPSLPAFITPAVLSVLVDAFDLKAITTPADDLRAILEPASAAAN